jgi:secondary thiamine-phosphate synthase enzyme
MPGIKTHTEYITLTTSKRYEMVHLTPQVEAIVKRSGIVDGLCFVSPMHITAAIYVNDNEDGLIEDISTWLEKLAPSWPGYKHHRTGEDNADAHLKSLLLHHQSTLPDQRAARPRHLAAHLLRRVRRSACQAHHYQGPRHREVASAQTRAGKG